VIITQTPCRVSFAGGGTDLPASYVREVGAVLSVGSACLRYLLKHGHEHGDAGDQRL
jgi:D-glycero-alpha-D-manno-heptose-7-phosphate kinase